MQSTGPDDNVEANIVSTEAWLEIAPAEAALVLVDVWGGHHVKSHYERTGAIMREKIAPAIRACRGAGVTIVYAPSPQVAARYPQSVRYAGDADLSPTAPEVDRDWPPEDYKTRCGRFSSFKKEPSEQPSGFAGPYPEWWHISAIAESIAPLPEDFVVANGDQLHRLLHHRRLVHLIYAGFATNICMIYRDYGLQAMRRRGYSPIVLRDCTSAIETRDTIESFAITKTVLLDLERWFYTADSESLIAACQSAAV